ncbi:MAG: hypothetical protein WA985_12170 [Erythrobacter sp.]|uniref:hypothetical protein n=1 Tax=Erythrobacter sp. TaxID=1042 RepID=UPI003C74E302
MASAFAATAALAAIVPVAANAQLPEPEPGMREIARTPLEILNIDPDEIPPVLVEAARDPYAHEDMETCNNIVREVARIDTVLGNDFDMAQAEDRDISIGNAAKSVIGSFIPFSGIIKEVSGANDRAAEVRYALTAGMVRRAYLKGLGQSRDCDYPARPSDMRVQIMAEKEAQERAEEAEEAAEGN